MNSRGGSIDIRAQIGRWSGLIVLLTFIHMLLFITMLYLAGVVQYASAYGTIAFHALHILIYWLATFVLWNTYNCTQNTARVERPISLTAFMVMLFILGILNIIYIVRAIIDTWACSGVLFCANAYGAFVTSALLSVFMLILQIIMFVSVITILRFINTAIGNPGACCIASDAKESRTGGYGMLEEVY